jgi:RNA polymerase sigma factor (sigma-70 family)
MASAADRLVHHIRRLVDPARGTSETDGHLLARWAAHRDDRAFAALVGRHGALVWQVSRSVLHQVEDAEDAFQATFLVLARKAATLQRHSSVAGWLNQTAYHLAAKSRRATARRLRREHGAEQKTVADPLDEISVREAGAILWEELDGIAALYREPLLLCLYEAATQDQAARRLGCSLKTLKRRLEHGRALLGRRLARRGLAPASAIALTLYAAALAPAQLVQRTIVAATQFAAGQAMTGTAVALAEGVLQTLLVKKLARSSSLLAARR